MNLNIFRRYIVILILLITKYSCQDNDKIYINHNDTFQNIDNILNIKDIYVKSLKEKIAYYSIENKINEMGNNQKNSKFSKNTMPFGYIELSSDLSSISNYNSQNKTNSNIFNIDINNKTDYLSKYDMLISNKYRKDNYSNQNIEYINLTFSHYVDIGLVNLNNTLIQYMKQEELYNIYKSMIDIYYTNKDNKNSFSKEMQRLLFDTNDLDLNFLNHGILNGVFIFIIDNNLSSSYNIIQIETTTIYFIFTNQSVSKMSILHTLITDYYNDIISINKLFYENVLVYTDIITKNLISYIPIKEINEINSLINNYFSLYSEYNLKFLNRINSSSYKIIFTVFSKDRDYNQILNSIYISINSINKKIILYEKIVLKKKEINLIMYYVLYFIFSLFIIFNIVSIIKEMKIKQINKLK